MLTHRIGQRARRRAVIERAINAQAQAVVTVEQRRIRDEERLKQLEDALDTLSTLTLRQRFRWLVLGRLNG